MNTEKSKATELWESKWPSEIHATEYASKRIKSAKSAKLTPVKIDRTDLYGYFQGSHGRYETFLDFCPCGDFHRSKLPCKHIYRLAIELGLMDINVSHDTNAIPTPIKERIDLESTINLVENLSENAQRRLLDISKQNSITPTCSVLFNKDIKELLDSGIIIDTNPLEFELNFGSKNNIIEFIEKENISYDKKAKKNDLKKLCYAYALKAKEYFGFYITVSIPTEFRVQKIHNYLHRKYDEYCCFGERPVHIPLLKTDLPDDDVTDQLKKRGYYSDENIINVRTIAIGIDPKDII